MWKMKTPWKFFIQIFEVNLAKSYLAKSVIASGFQSESWGLEAKMKNVPESQTITLDCLTVTKVLCSLDHIPRSRAS